MARPWKYDCLIQALKDDELYYTARVIAYCEEQGLFEVSFDDPTRRLNAIEKKNAMTNARSSLSHFVGKYLPQEPDGFESAKKPARVKYPAWFGWRWKQAQKATVSTSETSP